MKCSSLWVLHSFIIADMGTIVKTEWDNFCKKYSLSNEKEKGLQHLLFMTNESTRADERKLAEKAKVLKFLKATSNHKLSIEDTESDIKNMLVVDDENCVSLMGERLAEILISEYSMLHFSFIYKGNDKEKATYKDLKQLIDYWFDNIRCDAARELNHPTFLFKYLSLPMIDLMIKMFETILTDPKEAKLQGRQNQLIGYWGANLYGWYSTEIQAIPSICKAFAFDLLYLAEVIPHTDWHNGKNESYVAGTNQIYAGNNSGKAQYINAKIKCYKDAKP